MRWARTSAAAASVLASLVVAVVAEAAAPANDNFVNAQFLPADSLSVTGTTVEATVEPGEPDHGTGSIWFRWTPSASGKATIRTCDSNFDTNLAVYTGDRIDGLTRVAENDDGFACDSLGSQVRFEATAGATYRIAVASRWDEFGQVVLDVALDVPVPPANDAFGEAARLTGYEDSARGTNENATGEPGEPAHAGEVGGASVWYRWTAPGGGIAVIDSCASGFDTLLGVYTGAGVASLRRVAANDNGCGRQSRVSFFAKRGTTYRIAVDGRAGDTGRVRVDVEQVKAGHYSGRTEAGDGKPIHFALTPNGRRVKRFTLNQRLDCFRRQALVGDFTLKRVWLEPMRVKKTPAGGEFAKRVKVRFRGGGSLIIRVEGTLTAPDRARGRLKAKVRAPGGVTCRNFLFGTVGWRATQG